MLRELSSKDATFLEQCSRAPENRGHKRRYIARTVEELYPGRPDRYREHEQLPGGWVLCKNINNQTKGRLLSLAARVAGLEMGTDLVVPALVDKVDAQDGPEP